MIQLRRVVSALLIVACCGQGFVSPAESQGRVRYGIHMLGLGSLRPRHIDEMVNRAVEAQVARVEVGVLVDGSFGFQRSRDGVSIKLYKRLSRLVNRFVKRTDITLHLNLYLDNGAGRRGDREYVDNLPFLPGKGVNRFFRYRDGNRSEFDQKFTEFVQPVLTFVTECTAWLESRGEGDRVKFIVTPSLEDNFETEDMISHMQLVMRIFGSLAKYRRNPVLLDCREDKIRRLRVLDLPLEIHGNREVYLDKMRKHDTISPDGALVKYPWESRHDYKETPRCDHRGEALEFFVWRATIRDRARRLGINALFWRPEYNGLPHPSPPQRRGTLRPFENSGGEALVLALGR